MTPRRMLNATYKTAIPIEPFLMSCAVSSEKVENVVKLPQIPTFKNKISLWSRFAYFKTALESNFSKLENLGKDLYPDDDSLWKDFEI